MAYREVVMTKAQEKLLDGRPSSVGEFSHIGQFQIVRDLHSSPTGSVHLAKIKAPTHAPPTLATAQNQCCWHSLDPTDGAHTSKGPKETETQLTAAAAPALQEAQACTVPRRARRKTIAHGKAIWLVSDEQSSFEVARRSQRRNHVLPGNQVGQQDEDRDNCVWSGKETRQDDPMDVGAVMMKGKGKGKGKFKGKGKGFKGSSKGKGNKGGKQGKGKNNNNNGKGQQSKSSDVCWSCGKSGHHQKDCWSKNGKGGKGGKGGKSKGGAKNGKSVNAVDVQDAPEPETEQSYLELAMVERTDMPARAKARANPMLEVPDDFPDVGVSEIVRRLAYQRDVRLTNQGYARGSRPNWREEPVTRYRQRSMAFSEASRMKGSMREVTIKKITEAEGIDQACSSCDERYHASKSSVSKYAAQYVARMYSKRNKSAYDDEEEDSQDESSIDEADDESSGYEPSIAPNDVEEIEEEEVEASRTYYTDCPGGHGLKIHRTKEPGWTCSECQTSYPKNTNLMRCNQCDYDLCRNCFGPREDSMSKFEVELLEDSDEGAEADDEETDEDCEIEDILVGEMPEDEIGEGVSKVAKENLAVTKSFKGLKMNEGQQELFQELLDTRKEDEDFETFLNSPLVESTL
eukprot:symbB.v1.2.003095.t1/scaffold174.1/size397799/15